MDCQDCRKSLAGQKSLERWFASPAAAEAEVPAGFARRVARRAFAGDLGHGGPEAGEAESLRPTPGEAPIYSFVLWATAAAAGLLLIVSGMLFQVRLGSGDHLHADGKAPGLEQLLERADNLADPAFSGSTDPEGGAALEDMEDVDPKKAGRTPLRPADR